MSPTVADVRPAWPDLAPKGGGLAGPCPVCGGDDRFHVKDRGDGTALIRLGVDVLDRRTQEVRVHIAWFETAAGNAMPRLEMW